MFKSFKDLTTEELHEELDQIETKKKHIAENPKEMGSFLGILNFNKKQIKNEIERREKDGE